MMLPRMYDAHRMQCFLLEGSCSASSFKSATSFCAALRMVSLLRIIFKATSEAPPTAAGPALFSRHQQVHNNTQPTQSPCMHMHMAGKEFSESVPPENHRSQESSARRKQTDRFRQGWEARQKKKTTNRNAQNARARGVEEERGKKASQCQLSGHHAVCNYNLTSALTKKTKPLVWLFSWIGRF